MKSLIFFLLLHFAPAVTKAQPVGVSFAQLDSLQQHESRKVIVFLQAEWCNWCGAMKHTTFKDPQVVRTLNSRYYFVELNTEEKSTISFNGRRFGFKATGRATGAHELAQALGGETVPAICVLGEANEIIYQHTGYLSAKDFLKLLDALEDGKAVGK